MTSRLCTAKVVARLLDVPESWVREHTRSGAMPAIPIGRYWRYDLDDVRAWIDSCKQPGRPVTFRRHSPRKIS